MNKILLRLAIVLLFFGPPSLGYTQGDSATTQGTAASSEVPSSARFNIDGLEEGKHTIVGRLSLRRQFLGTRATPAFKDVVQFHSFDGSELRFAKFADHDLENRFAKQLADGYPLPAVITIEGSKTQIGHDGINMSMRFFSKIKECETLTPEAISAAAKAAGHEEAAIEKFEASLKPSADSNGVAVSIERIYVRSKTARQGSAVSFLGIEVFNPLTDAATVKITRVWFEQAGNTHECELNERSQGPSNWEIEAESWADGVYETGKMPKRIWMFQPTAEIEPTEKVTVHLEMELNGEAVTVTKTVDPK